MPVFRLAALVVVPVVALLVPGCRGPTDGQDRSFQRVKAAGKLLVATDPTYPPMEFEQRDGQPAGFDVDFARELASRLGVEAEFVVMDWSGIVAGLHSRRYDVIVSAMNVTEERRRQVDFVEYLQMSQVFVCPQGATVKTEHDLAGKVVAVQTSTTSHTWAEDVKQKGIAIREIKAFPNATDCFNAVKSGQAEVVVTDEPVGKYYARRDATFVVTGQAMEPLAVGVALRKEDERLRVAVAQAVAEMKRDGAFHRISESWFGGELGLSAVEDSGFWRFSATVVIPRLLQGLGLTLQLTLTSGFLGIALGLVLSLARLSRNRLLSRSVLVYVTLFRGTPLLLQILFVYFALPPLLDIRLGAVLSGILALSLNGAAYTAEIFRAAIQSIDRGQMEAARALGMSYAQAMRRIILPQTLRRLLPPLVNELAALTKDTSLVMVIALHELLYETQRLAAAYLRPWEVYAWAALAYLLLVLVLSGLAGYLEKRLERRGA